MDNVLKRRVKKIFFPLIALLAIIIALYFFVEWRKLQENPQAVAQKEAETLVEKVSKLILLPTGEIPTVATVSVIEALKDQPFFTNAQKGDKVLIYAGAKKAFLYSVTLNKVLDVAPLSIGQDAVK